MYYKYKMGDSFDPKIDYYNVLGVSTDATGDSVRNAYIQLGTLQINVPTHLIITRSNIDDPFFYQP